jgi:hypothetical protein
MTAYFIQIGPIPTGRVHEDGLSPTERAFVDALTELPRDALRRVVTELLSWEKFRVELELLLLPRDDEV